MAVNENDYELLSAYLDGELPVAECEGLWRRLAIERELMSELDTLRADHAVRGMAWSTLDPDDHAVARVESRIIAPPAVKTSSIVSITSAESSPP